MVGKLSAVFSTSAFSQTETFIAILPPAYALNRKPHLVRLKIAEALTAGRGEAQGCAERARPTWM